ncbi:MAG: Rossmann fold nucleotide-binding protein Smf [Candidatus Ozemobacter sibiricus]|uniref:Rossmann fold nucleotide-binding protein Smf n=1 Tax=Candidatus Ozemobacter sibiricus TaxID=2268124 RepID=A0A367ZJ72_9BACT|nr:MAG: Rossmann fold nucleotide-binding protein Smf [Candidatus Ozemobacter sibiricus]
MGRELILAALRLSRAPGVGAARFRELLRRHGDPATALAAWLADLPACRATLPAVSRRKSPTLDGLAAAEAWLAAGGTAVWWGGPGYPAALLDLPEPPPVLFLRGTLPEGPATAIVGTRHPVPAALALAEHLAADLARRGVTIVSGGAAGIDAAAHRGALAAGGRTVAVLGTGVDVVFPPDHAELFARIAAQGALVSELLPGTGPRRGFFPTRNRIIAGLAAETIVVQAPRRSGACLTARAARRYGRPVRVVVPPCPDDPAWAGNLALLAAGARPLAVLLSQPSPSAARD